MKLFTLILGLLLSTSCHAQNFDISSWDAQSKIAYGVYVTGLVIDVKQTNEIRRRDDIHELNPFLRDKPSARQINQHFIAAGLLMYGIASILSDEERKYFLTGIATIQIINVTRNSIVFGLGRSW